MTETEKSYVAEVEVPGWKMSELELSVQGDELTIKGQRAESGEAKGEDVTFLRRERSETGFPFYRGRQARPDRRSSSQATPGLTRCPVPSLHFPPFPSHSCRFARCQVKKESFANVHIPCPPYHSHFPQLPF